MKNRAQISNKIIFFLIFFLSGLIHLYTQDNNELLNVAVLYKKTDQTDLQTEELYRQAGISFTLPLQIAGGYRIAEKPIAIEGTTGEELLKEIRGMDLDAAAFLDFTRKSGDSFDLKVAIYDTRQGNVLFSGEKRAGSYPAALEQSDRLIEEGITAILPGGPAFGSIKVDTESDAALLRYRINGIPGGGGKYMRTLIPAGRWKVEISQIRPFGELEVFSGQVALSANKTELITLVIPEITETEQDGFASLEEGLFSAWRKGDNKSAQMQFILAFALLEDPQPSAAIQGFRDKYQEWYTSFQNGEIPEGLRERFADAEAREEKKPETGIFSEQDRAKIKPGPRFGQALTMSLGALLSTAGSAAEVYSVEKRIEAEATYGEYSTASENFDTIFADYTDLYNQYKAGSIAAYSGWGAGTLALASSFLFFPEESLSLSAPGRYAATAALIMGVAGNLFQHLANRQVVENYLLYENYSAASENLDILFDDYESGFRLYKTGRIGGLVFWGAGTALMAGSLFLPGTKEPVLTSWFDRILMTAGVLLITGGNLSSSFAHTYYMDADEKYREYQSAGSNLEELYTSYKDLLDNYQLTSILAYSGWIAGTAAILTSLYVPFKSRAPVRTRKEKPGLLFFPSPNGIHLNMRL